MQILIISIYLVAQIINLKWMASVKSRNIQRYLSICVICTNDPSWLSCSIKNQLLFSTSAFSFPWFIPRQSLLRIDEIPADRSKAARNLMRHTSHWPIINMEQLLSAFTRPTRKHCIRSTARSPFVCVQNNLAIYRRLYLIASIDYRRD